MRRIRSRLSRSIFAVLLAGMSFGTGGLAVFADQRMVAMVCWVLVLSMLLAAVGWSVFLFRLQRERRIAPAANIPRNG